MDQDTELAHCTLHAMGMWALAGLGYWKQQAPSANLQPLEDALNKFLDDLDHCAAAAGGERQQPDHQQQPQQQPAQSEPQPQPPQPPQQPPQERRPGRRGR